MNKGLRESYSYEAAMEKAKGKGKDGGGGQSYDSLMKSMGLR